MYDDIAPYLSPTVRHLTSLSIHLDHPKNATKPFASKTMRIPFATICVAIAVFRAGVCSYAAPSRSILQAPRSLLGVATKRYLRSDKLERDDEERVNLDFIRNELLGEEEIVGETSESLWTEAEQLKLMKELEQLAKPVASEEKKTIEELLYGWDQISTSFKQELEKAKTTKFKEVVEGSQKKKKIHGEKIRKKVLDGWKVPDKSIESESKSSTENLQAWLEKKESAENKEPVDNDKSAYELFKVLGIHKAADEAANGLLISMNLERWNFVMESLLKTKEEKEKYNFESKLLETLNVYCEDDDRAKLFLERLVIVRQNTDSVQLSLLHKMQHPDDVLKLIYDAEQNRNDYGKVSLWIPYLKAYNNLYPENRVILFTIMDKHEDFWIDMVFEDKILFFPKASSISRQILEEILKAWAEADSPHSLADVLKRLKLKLLSTDESLSLTSLKIMQQYLIYRTAGEQTLREDLIKNLLVELNWPHDTADIKRADDYLKNCFKEKKPLKREAESPPEDTRKGRRRRGE